MSPPADPLRRWLGDAELAATPSAHADWLRGVIDRDGGLPTLEALWALMDEAWRAHGCDPQVTDARITAFYRDPVWLLNTLFIEQDAESLAHRRLFADWAARQAPRRVADVGGGGGTLARAVADACPGARVDVVEPHPHPALAQRLAGHPQVAYVPALHGPYDVMLATDVFEHVPDPVGMLAEVLPHLRPGGAMLIANCFWPVIACHLPQTFPLRHAWDAVCEALGLQGGPRLAHGRTWRLPEAFDPATALPRARAVEARARAWHSRISALPRPLSTRFGPWIFRWLA
ncbi:MAG: class I SAM-dependent methyltransferase [Burkholderiaceae bacterium]|nr:class I SAM-dependent methyltransferase [Burkholderiaceae bacterium]